MTKWAVGALALVGTAWAQTGDEPAIRAKIQERLAHEKPACVAMFDPNDPTGHILLKTGRGLFPTPRLDAYYEHGLLVRKNVHVDFGNAGILPMNAIFSKRNNAWRYDWAPGASADVRDDELCYGYDRVVERIVRIGTESAEFTWKFSRVADWIKQNWLKRADKGAWENANEPTHQERLALVTH